MSTANIKALMKRLYLIWMFILSAFTVKVYCQPAVKAKPINDSIIIPIDTGFMDQMDSYFMDGIDAVLPKVFPLAPNTAAQAKFGDIPVNHFTGVPDISIPIYTIQSGSISVPITLAYHANGIRVADIASWVGLGWSLDAGAIITRKVMGLFDDEGTSGYLNGNLMQENYVFDMCDDITYLNNVATGAVDTEPDIYSFSLPGRSGKFFFNGQDDMEIKQLPYSPVKIEDKYTSSNRLMFNIIDESGNYHAFGKSQSSREGSTNELGIGGVTAWRVDTIISQNRRDSVFFEYTTQSFYLNSYSYHVTLTDLVTNANYATPGLSQHFQGSNVNNTTECLPSVIKFKNGKIVFTRSDNSRSDLPACYSLKDIKVYTYNYQTSSYDLLKKIQFHYSYFTSNRLKLDSLSILDKSDQLIERYRFQYETSINLPARNSLECDLWGYYNHASGNNSLIPATEIDDYQAWASSLPTVIQISNNNRDVDTSYIQANILKKIYYPTGGYTEFEYEANRYTNESQQIIYAGGLRIRAIKNFTESSGTPILRTYIYDAGVRNFLEPDFYYRIEHMSEEIIQYEQSGEIHYELASKRERTFISNPTSDIIPYDGSLVVYPRVTEFIGNGSNNIGKTVFEYTFNPDVYDMTLLTSTKGRRESRFFSRGQLSKKSVFAHNTSGTYLPVAMESYIYNSPFAESIYENVGFVAEQYYTTWAYENDCETMNLYYYSPYDIASDDNYLVSKTEKVYDQEDTTKMLTITTNYYYDNLIHQQVNRTKTVNSKGDSLIVTTRYPQDYVLSGKTQTDNTVLDAMRNKNMQAAVIEQYNTVKISGTAYTTGGILNKYKVLTSGGFDVDSVSVLEIVSPITGFTVSNVNTSGVFQKDYRYKRYIKYNSYDSKNNLQQYTPRISDPVSIVWGYNQSEPVLKVEGMSFSDLSAAYSSLISYLQTNSNLPSARTYSSVSAKVTSIKSTLSALLNNKTCQVTLYTYCPQVGLTSQTDPNGMTTYYDYDDYGRLILVRDNDGNILKSYDYHYKP